MLFGRFRFGTLAWAVNECIPFYEASYTQKLTVHFDVGVGGKIFCAPLAQRQSGPGLAADPLATGDGGNYRTPGLPAAGGKVGGVVGWDVATGAKGSVIRGAGTILPVLSGAAVAQGNEVQVDATGRVIPLAAGKPVGLAHSAAGGAGVEVEVELYAVGAN
jgi:hypothetical protein